MFHNFSCTMSVRSCLVHVCTLLALQRGISSTDSCSYWYSLVPNLELNCNPLGVDVSLVCGVYVPRDPPTTVKWYRSEFPQNDTKIFVISDSTDRYELTTQPAKAPDTGGNFSGLFFDTYDLVITNFAASDTGYYWCQIETNSTEVPLTLLLSQYGYRVPNPGKAMCAGRLVHIEHLNPAVCAVQLIPTPSFNPTISHILTSHSSATHIHISDNAVFPSSLMSSGNLVFSSTRFPLTDFKSSSLFASSLCPHLLTSVVRESMQVTPMITPSTTVHSASLKMSPPSTTLTPSAKVQITKSPKSSILTLSAKIQITKSSKGSILTPSAKVQIIKSPKSSILTPSAKIQITKSSKGSVLAPSTKVQITESPPSSILIPSAKGPVTLSVTPGLRHITITFKPVNKFVIFGVAGGAMLLLICVATVIVPCIVVCQCKKRRGQLWKERGRASNTYMYRPSLAEDHAYSMICHSTPEDGPIYAKPVVEETSKMLGEYVNRTQSPAHSLDGATDDEYAMPQDAVLPDVVPQPKRRNVTPYDDPLQEASRVTTSMTPKICDPVYSVPVVDQSNKHAKVDHEKDYSTRTAHALSEASPGSSEHEYAVLEPNSEQATPHHCHVGSTQELHSCPDAQEVMFDNPIYSAGRVN